MFSGRTGMTGITLARSLFALLFFILLGLPPLAAQEGKERPREKKEKAADRGTTHPLAQGKVVLSFGNLLSVATGGGDTHGGEEAVRVVPAAVLGFQCFAVKGFGIGLIGGLDYLKSQNDFSFQFLTFRQSSRTFNWHVGPSFAYYFSASERFLPYIGIAYTYGQRNVTSSLEFVGSSTVATMELTASFGVVYVVRNFFGISVELYHLRDFRDPMGEMKMGHLTGIHFGFKIFI